MTSSTRRTTPERQKGKFKQNQFGGSLGPIRKNKTFFADYMGFQINQAQPVLATVPPRSARRRFYRVVSGRGREAYLRPGIDADRSRNRAADPRPVPEQPDSGRPAGSHRAEAAQPLPAADVQRSAGGEFLANPVSRNSTRIT
jgi:hypothetical protein